MRRPVPHYRHCEKTVTHTARVWTPKFGQRVAYDDLVQEGWIVAHRVLRDYDPNRGARIETLLVLALRHHFGRLAKTMRRKQLDLPAFDYYTQAHHVGADRTTEARIMLARLHDMPPDDQYLAADLVEFETLPLPRRVKKIAKRRGWSVPFTKIRIVELRAMLRGTYPNGFPSTIRTKSRIR